MFNGEKTYDNRTREINSAEELLIGIRTAGSQGHVCNQDGDQRISGTRVAVCMEEKGAGCNRVQGCIQLVSESGMRTGTT